VDIPPIKGHNPETGEPVTCKAKNSEPLAALIFKVSIMESRKLSFVRVYSGELTTGAEVYNPFRKTKEKLARILQMHANKRERLDKAGAGSIVGVIGLKDSSTGETLCSLKKPVVLERIEFYDPVISIAVEPKTHADQEKLDQVLDKFIAEDPTLKVRKDDDTGQTILSGMGELHLEVIISRMLREFNTRVNVGKPQVVYRETISKEAQATAIFDKEVSGQHHFGQVSLSIKPLTRGKGNHFKSEIEPDTLPEDFIPFIEKGIMEALTSGTLRGYPVTDVKVTLKEVSYKESLSSELAYRVSASMACREALNKAEPFLMEPMMRVDIFVPESFTGEVIGDLNSRGGKIESITHRIADQTISATVPLSCMFGYSTALRSSTQGRGTFSMQFSHFDRH
jgi:elongation factor G